MKQWRRTIGWIMAVAALLRGGYLYWGWRQWGDNLFVNGDSFSFSRTALYLIRQGLYTSDPTLPDAAVGRLPGYPFWWGLHYQLAGEHTYWMVAVSQLLVDVSTVAALALLARRLHSRPAGVLAAALYALYPIAWWWVPITGTETLATAITLWYLYFLSGAPVGGRYWIGLGVWVATAFFIREYLGVLAPLTVMALLLKTGWSTSFLRAVLGFSLGFCLIYGWWPLRNWVSLHRIEWLKPGGAGYPKYGPEFSAFRDWAYTRTTDIQPLIEQIMARQTPALPPSWFGSAAEGRYIDSLLREAMVKAPDFLAWQGQPAPAERAQSTAPAFDSLRHLYISRDPVGYYLLLPAQNLSKAFFKRTMQKERAGLGGWAVIIALLWRSLWLLLGFLGCWWLRRSVAGVVLASFSLFMYVYITFAVRQVEMRYLLQADVCLLVPAAIGVARLSGRVRP